MTDHPQPPHSPARPLRVALVDDHTFVREGVVAVLSHFDDIETVAAVGSVEALSAHPGPEPQIVVLDLNLPHGPSGPAAVRAVRDLGYPVLVLTAESDPGRLLAAIRAGALGFVGKSADAVSFCAAIRATAAGESLITPAVAARMETESRTSARLIFPPALADVLRLLAHGFDNQTIARRRHVSLSTVKKQIREIRDTYAAAGVEVTDRATLRDAARRYYRDEWSS